MLVGIEASAAVSGRRTGVGHYVANLMSALGRVAGDDVDFVYFSNRYDESMNDGLPDGRDAVYTHDRLPSRLLWMQLGLPRSLARTRPDICHFPNHLLPAVGSGRRPTVVTMHDMSVYRFPWSQPAKTVLVHRALLPLARQGRCSIVTVSKSARQDIVEYLHVPEERIHVIYEGVDPMFHPGPEEGDGAILAEHGVGFPYVLSVGTMEPRKNQARLIEAFTTLVKQERLPHHLVIAGGDGWHDAGLRRLLHGRQMAGRIHVLGYVPTRHLPALYRGAAAFAFPSLYEGFGLPVLEALASGAPTLISTDPALREVALDAAVAVDPYSVDDIASGLWGLLTDGAMCYRLRQNGTARSRQFTWDRCAADTLALYRETLELQTGRPATSRTVPGGRSRGYPVGDQTI